MTTDFRRADPTYVGFVPQTAYDAIDLFGRFQRLGLHTEHYPETFVWVSRALNNEEGAKFEEWLCAPQGHNESMPLYEPDPVLEAEREQLLKEAEARDAADRLAKMTISEEEDVEMDEDDEKVPSLEAEDVEMVTPSPR